MKKIRVLHILSDTNVGGAGKLLLNLSKCIDKSKFEFVFAFPRGSNLIILFKNIGKIYVFDGYGDKSLDIKAIGSIRQIIKKSNPDIVHTHSSLSGRIAAVMNGVKKDRIVYTKHCVFDIPESKKKPLRRKIYNILDNVLSGHIIAVAESAKKELIDMGVDPQKITVIINGSIPLRKASNNEIISTKERLGIAKDDFVVGISARLEEYKGHKTFIRAAWFAKKEKENIKFIIMGDGSKREELKNHVQSLELQDRVVFTGFVDNVSEYMNIFDLNVNCSIGTETSSLSISEGLSLGIPAIASNFGGNPNMVLNGKTGFIFERNNAEQLYKIIKMLKISPQKLLNMGKAAINDFESRFSATKMASQYEKFYYNILYNIEIK